MKTLFKIFAGFTILLVITTILSLAFAGATYDDRLEEYKTLVENKRKELEKSTELKIAAVEKKYTEDIAQVANRPKNGSDQHHIDREIIKDYIRDKERAPHTIKHMASYDLSGYNNILAKKMGIKQEDIIKIEIYIMPKL